MIFFRQKLEEVITLPPPPKDDMAEALKVNEITLIRTPEQVQSVRDHDQNPYFAIKKVIKKYKLEFHPNELEQIIKESVPIITHFKNFYNRKRPHVVLPRINTLPSETNKTPSYPSGHACQSVIIARYVAGKEPKAERELIKAAYECGYGRVIAGFHYPSDFVTGNLLGEKMYVMMNKADFGAEMAEDIARGTRIKYKDLSQSLKKLI
jgi:acid phosphatase (class A)